VKVTNVNLVNREKTPNGGFGVANIRRGTVEVTNITNQSPGEMVMKADAWLENKAHFNLALQFSTCSLNLTSMQLFNHLT
jgi:hypothetical protein